MTAEYGRGMQSSEGVRKRALVKFRDNFSLVFLNDFFF